MQSTSVLHHAARRHVVPLSPGVTTRTISELYDAVRYKNGNTVIRAGQDSVDHWYVYVPKKESKLAAATYKSSSIKRHRQAMAALLLETSNTLDVDVCSGGNQKNALISLRMMALNKNVATQDFRVKELVPALKPLSDHLRGRERLKKTSAIKSATSPILKTRRDYLMQFLKMSDSDLRVMQQAIFPRDDVYSFQEKKLILKSIFSLIKAYVNQKEGKKTIAQLIQQSPQQDLLVKFANAWMDHVGKRQINNRPNLLVVFSWQKTISVVCQKILAELPEKSPGTPVVSSPERSLVLKKMIDKSRHSMDGIEIDTPTKFPRPSRLASIEELPAPLSPVSDPGTPVFLQQIAKSEPVVLQSPGGDQAMEFGLCQSPGLSSPVKPDMVEVEGAYEISVDPNTITRRTDNWS